jgi:hypothetical protein
LYSLLFDKKENAKLAKLFSGEVFFYAPVLKGKYHQTESFSFVNGKLKSSSREITLSPKTLTEELKNENFNDLKLIQCLFHNISVQAKYVEGIAKDIESLEDGEMIKTSKPSISDTPSYC